MDRQHLIVVTPPVPLSSSLATAACRAGALGVLDLQWAGPDDAAAWRELERLAQHAHGRYGVLLGAEAAGWLRALAEGGLAGLSHVVLTDEALTSESAQAVRQLGAGLILQTVDVDAAQRVESGLVDGVILKGQESGGRVGSETAFVMLQRWCQLTGEAGGAETPVWVQGGIGPHTAAAAAAAGVRGVVLDAQLLLTRESPLTADVRAWLTSVDGSESRVLGEELGQPFRFLAPPRCSVVETLQGELSELLSASTGEPQKQQGVETGDAGCGSDAQRWREAVRRAVAAGALPWGQDAALASSLADAHATVGGVITAVVSQVRESLRLAAEEQPLAPGAPLAESHGTRYPLLQGPMTRVSDVAEFAGSVAEAGGLPFLALALLRGPQVETLLQQTAEQLAERPWGVGLLGFLPPEIRQEQVAVIKRHRPPFALIAGGRPDQARELEQDGIPTYLHVPSPGLLRMFLKDGARRFVFEGRECGGHVGPRSSFLLWETMCQLLLEHLGPHGRDEQLHVVFAGGIHDSLSGAMLAAMAAPLAARGVKVGALMGTAYLFTREAVEAGAIVPRFQQEALAAGRTVLLQTGPGHAIRCIPTPYYDVFEREKNRLQAAGKSHEEIVKALEWMNIGRLRVASKGIDRVEDQDGQRRLAPVPDQQQFERGMYMIGQVAAMHRQVLGMEQLHEDVCCGGQNRLLKLAPPARPRAAEPRPCDVAIIGMSTFYPASTNLQQYWENILNSVYAVTEIPLTHWDWRLYYDADPMARDKIISKWGGFLGDVPFDPFRYGITPKSITSIEPLHLLLLESVRLAMEDAGYAKRDFDRENTCAVLGVGGGGSPLAVLYGLRSCMPLIDTIEGLPVKSDEILRRAGDLLPEWTEDSFPGFLLNVAVGRVANRFNFGGSNYAVDAACASSLAAVHSCIRELELGTADVAVAMGADTVQTPYSYMAFSKTYALSPNGRCRPFDEEADGIVLSEGIGSVVLKRLADAERDGDEIYAVIRGVGASSDGREKGLTAPNASGQLRALQRAYQKAGLSPARVELIEAHGTGTVVGDQTEANSLTSVMQQAGAAQQSCALGSVKSMIGHSKCAAGIAGLIKTAKALHHKVLPPTLVETPNSKANFPDSALYLNTEARPWIHAAGDPRVAGVSAFGFGGTNVHMVLEEYTDGFLEPPPPALRDWPCELLVWRAGGREQLAGQVQSCLDKLSAGARPALNELAASLWRTCPRDPAQPTLAVVADSLADLQDKLRSALETLRGDQAELRDPRGVFFTQDPAQARGQVAFLFPGQGSQYPNMLADAAMNFTEVRQAFDEASALLDDCWDRPLGRFVYPPSAFSDQQKAEHAEALASTDVAQPAIGAASLGLLRLLRSLGVEADCLAGHSYGELTALCAAGALEGVSLLRLSHRRGQLMRQASGQGGGAMAALGADRATVERLLEGLDDVWLANLNGPRQTVVSGTPAALEALQERAESERVSCQRLAVSCGFHSPLVHGASEPFAAELQQAGWTLPRQPVYSNVTAEPYAESRDELLDVLKQHMNSTVRFAEQIEAMHAAGVRTFVEVGPHQVLTGLVGRILDGRPHTAVAADSKSRRGLVQLSHLLGQLMAGGVAVDLGPLYSRRQLRTFDVARLERETGEVEHTPSTWIVNGTRSRPLKSPEPRFLGQPAETSESQPEQPLSTAPAAMAAAQPAHGAPVSKTGAPPVGAAASSSPSSSRHATSPAMQPNSQITNRHRTDAPSAPPASSLPGAPADEAATVMLGFQDLMARFLDTQRAVMSSYLSGQPAETPALLRTAPAPSVTSNGNGSGSGARPDGDSHTAPRSNGSSPASFPASRFTLPESGVSPQATAAGGNGNGEAAADQPPLSQSAPADAAPSQTPASPSAPAEAKTLDEISVELLDLVSERTGYPQEMLDLDLDLEADLGIDSIKRVEILGGLAESLGASEDDESSLSGKLELEKLTTIRNLRGILEYLDDALFGDPPPAGATDPAPASETPSVAGAAADADTLGDAGNGSANAPADGALHRGLVELTETPLPAAATPLIPRGAVLITDDGRGVAREVSDRLADFGQQIIVLKDQAGGEPRWRGDTCTVDLCCPELVGRAIAAARDKHGELGGLVHAAALDGSAGADARLRHVKALYVLARELESDLRSAAVDGGAFLLAATALGGRLGFGPQPLSDLSAVCDGGMLGLLKCIIHEWPDVLVRAVDFDATLDSAELADRLLSELGDRDGPAEVAWDGPQRLTWSPVEAVLDRSVAELELPAGGTILVTGGARGITSAIAQELSRRCRPHLVLVGRSPLPEDEPADTAGLEATAEVKAALMRRCSDAGRPVAPAEIEKLYQQLLKDREIRASLQALREAGASVEYHSVDVRDQQAMQALLADVTQRRGAIDGVIHGAGVIEDKLLRDKTPESYERVVSTKVDSALLLARLLDPQPLKFCVFFSSIAGRYGNRGQSDYAAANEVLAKLAWQLDRQWPCRVLVVDWGPWKGLGMVADLEKHMTARGVALIAPEVGADLLLDELQYGRKGETEVMIAGGATNLHTPPRSQQATLV